MRTWALDDACHVQHVVFVRNDAYSLRGIGSELSKLAHEAAQDGRRDRLLQTLVSQQNRSIWDIPWLEDGRWRERDARMRVEVVVRSQPGWRPIHLRPALILRGDCDVTCHNLPAAVTLMAYSPMARAPTADHQGVEHIYQW